MVCVFQLSFAKVIEVLDVSCLQEQQKSCVALGVFYKEDGREAEGFQFFEQACTAGDAEGCHWKSKALLEGLGVAKDEDVALTLLKQSCGDGFALSCFELGMYFADEGQQDLKRFTDYLDRGCSLGHKRSCRRLVEVYMKGYRTIDKDELLVEKYRKLSGDL